MLNSPRYSKSRIWFLCSFWGTLHENLRRCNPWVCWSRRCSPWRGSIEEISAAAKAEARVPKPSATALRSASFPFLISWWIVLRCWRIMVVWATDLLATAFRLVLASALLPEVCYSMFWKQFSIACNCDKEYFALTLSWWTSWASCARELLHST